MTDIAQICFTKKAEDFDLRKKGLIVTQAVLRKEACFSTTIERLIYRRRPT